MPGHPITCSRRLAVWFVEEEEEEQLVRKGRGKKAAPHHPTGQFYVVGVQLCMAACLGCFKTAAFCGGRALEMTHPLAGAQVHTACRSPVAHLLP